MSAPVNIDDWQSKYEETDTFTIVKLYGDHAQIYDKVMGDHMDIVNALTIDSVLKYIPDKQTRALDFAACTGLFGEQLHKYGYTNVDAFDGSAECIEECKKKNIYTNFLVEFVSDKQLHIPDDSYDAVVCVGGFSKNHLPISTFSEWVRILKPGGYSINSFRLKWLTVEPMYNEGKMLAELERLEKEGKWKCISREEDNEKEEDKRFVKYIHQVV
ncbi:methyltransferase-like protein 27 isoform X2 [Antedon mediterranea]|uniref:methyltransferase-like protein 27 isoform X2 n=1 Tax=Antedon mediterranea TaxID=105859 RepID=UPI003AF6CA9F